MSKENRSELIHEALNLLDEDLIEDVDRLRGGVVEPVSKSEKANEIEEAKKIGKVQWRRWTALAASICVLVVGSWAWQNFHEPDWDAEQEKGAKEDFMLNQEGMEEVQEVSPEKDGLHNDKNEEHDASKEDFMVETEEAPSKNEVPVESEKLLVSYEALKENYVRVSMLPHKIWESSSDMDAAMQQAVVIDAKYKADMDKLVGAMSAGTVVSTSKIESTDPDMTYHLFFEKESGELVHCQLLEGGYICESTDSDWCVVIDKEVYDNTFKILAMHW